MDIMTTRQIIFIWSCYNLGFLVAVFFMLILNSREWAASVDQNQYHWAIKKVKDFKKEIIQTKQLAAIGWAQTISQIMF